MCLCSIRNVVGTTFDDNNICSIHTTCNSVCRIALHFAENDNKHDIHFRNRKCALSFSLSLAIRMRIYYVLKCMTESDKSHNGQTTVLTVQKSVNTMPISKWKNSTQSLNHLYFFFLRSVQLGCMLVITHKYSVSCVFMRFFFSSSLFLDLNRFFFCLKIISIGLKIDMESKSVSFNQPIL